jgi:transcriptional regulator with XRE-family HTH domain
MSTKRVKGSPSSTSSARSKMRKTTEKAPARERSLTPSEPDVLPSPNSRSKWRMMLRTQEAQLSLANDVSFRVALNAIKLRKFRNLSQAAVASAMGTSQPKVARIESGDDNITLATLRKLIDALHGRLVLAIQPAEIHVPSLPEWWEAPLFASQCVWQPAGAQIDDIDPGLTTLVAAWKTSQTVVTQGSPVQVELPGDLA